MTPGGERILAELLALFFALYILLDGLAHHPVRRAPPRRCEPPDALFCLDIELQTGSRGRCHCKCSSVLPHNTIVLDVRGDKICLAQRVLPPQPGKARKIP